MNNQAPSIYESFNARTLTNEQLCKSFIISEDFKELASTNHTILIGPRGSGKTTLVRMLQAEALDIWCDPQAQSFRESVTFSGVFVPTDRFWKTQYQHIRDSQTHSRKLEALLLSTFTYHTLERLTDTLEYRTKRSKRNFKPINISKTDECELVKELAELWCVTPKIPSIRSLETSITAKKKEITDYITGVYFNSGLVEVMPKTIGGEITSILGSSIRIINAYINERGHKWGFLFDELELAPEEIIQPLVDSMRGGAEDLILKLSLSPYHKNLSVTVNSDSSMNKQDVSFINLTGKSEKSGLDFSKRLCSSIFKKNDLEKMISHYFKVPGDISTEKVFSELSEKDPTFREYLDNKKIIISNISAYTEKDKAPNVRKIKFVAYLRNYYIKKGRMASRKRCPDYYAGFDNLCKAMEYNPRMLIGLVNNLLPYAKTVDSIAVSQQLKALEDIFNSYKALLNTIAIRSENDRFASIFDLVHEIASFFGWEIVQPEFIPEPKGTLTFEKEANSDFLDAVGLALNAGALITDADRKEPIHNLEDLKDARCRLSHIFSHKYHLLFAKSREIELSDLLSESQTGRKLALSKAKKVESKQLGLL